MLDFMGLIILALIITVWLAGGIADIFNAAFTQLKNKIKNKEK
jgi:hypothetical protein